MISSTIITGKVAVDPNNQNKTDLESLNSSDINEELSIFDSDRSDNRSSFSSFSLDGVTSTEWEGLLNDDTNNWITRTPSNVTFDTDSQLSFDEDSLRYSFASSNTDVSFFNDVNSHPYKVRLFHEPLLSQPIDWSVPKKDNEDFKLFILDKPLPNLPNPTGSGLSEREINNLEPSTPTLSMLKLDENIGNYINTLNN